LLAPGADKIIEEVCKFYQVHKKDLIESGRIFFNKSRNIAIYLTRYLRSDNLINVGKIFEIAKNSSISSVVERLKREMIRDNKIKKRIEILRGELAKGQE
jgi:chromosomal replication initiation ATPase DnaA